MHRALVLHETKQQETAQSHVSAPERKLQLKKDLFPLTQWKPSSIQATQHKSSG